MTKLMMVAGVVAVAASMIGCKSTMDDRWCAEMGASIEDAHFKPVYEVLTEKGIVKGEASESYTWWGIFGSGPDTFANEIGGPLTFKPGLKEAAFADACAKANCQILLAPRYTISKKVGFLWFSGDSKVVVEGIPAVLKTAKEIPLAKWYEYQSKLPAKATPVPAIPGAGLLPF